MELGQLVITATLKEHCDTHKLKVEPFLDQYTQHIWGELSPEDIQSNNDELNEVAGHVIGKYNLPTGEDIYIETSWSDTERYTVVMFRDER